MCNNTRDWPKSRLSIVYRTYQCVVRQLVWGSQKIRWREKDWTGYGRGPLILRLLVSHLGPGVEGGEKGGGERKRLVEKKGTKYGGKRDDEATRIEKEDADEGRREMRRGWDEKFSLASLRCLYTRGSCMAMGHISVLRERGAPPKNQIECKNRINSSCKLESYVCPVGSLSKLSLFLFPFSLEAFLSHSVPSLSYTLFTLSSFDPFLFLSRPLLLHLLLHNQVYKLACMTPPRGKADHLLYFLLFCLSASTKVMWLARLMKNPLFIDK